VPRTSPASNQDLICSGLLPVGATAVAALAGSFTALVCPFMVETAIFISGLLFLVESIMSQPTAISINITLDSQNYCEWAFCVETALSGHGLLFHLTDDPLATITSNASEIKTWNNNDGKVMTAIVNSVKQSIIMGLYSRQPSLGGLIYRSVMFKMIVVLPFTLLCRRSI
jgi:hypothetical protein